METNSIWVVIPTYWGSSGLGLYDHPTPINGPSTLSRLLDSLVQQKFSNPFTTLILVSAVSTEHETSALTRTREVLSSFKDKLKINLADTTIVSLINKYLLTHQIDLKISGMRGYSTVRNIQLLVPAALGAKTIIALDDDEIVPVNFLDQATKWIGKKQNNKKIRGLVGPYLDEFGSLFLSEEKQVSNILLDKSVIMNKTMQQLIDESIESNDLPVTPMGFGGNMVFDESLFSQVGFDPAIPRGEDIDYIINARIAGHTFHFDQNLTITHLPPRQFEAPEYAKLRQDVFRFIYERKKLEFFDLSPKLFEPYPGDLLTGQFLLEAKKALQATADPDMVIQFGTPEDIIQSAQSHATKNISQYETFSKHWPNAITALKDHAICSELINKIK